MSNLSGRIPSSVEWEIEELLAQYQDNITSILGQFPALQVSRLDGERVSSSLLAVSAGGYYST